MLRRSNITNLSKLKIRRMVALTGRSDAEPLRGHSEVTEEPEIESDDDFGAQRMSATYLHDWNAKSCSVCSVFWHFLSNHADLCYIFTDTPLFGGVFC